MGHGQHIGSSPSGSALNLVEVWQQLQAWAHDAGFSQIAVADVDLASAEPGFLAWLEAGFAGSMQYMGAHGLKRLRPAELVPGTVRVITARMDYLPRHTPPDWREVELARLQRPTEAVVSLYARGRDYHRVLRSRLARLGEQLQALIGPFGHRAFVDSAPVAEVELAQRSGLGWRGKHTLLLQREAGSMFFLGELFIDLPLPLTPPVSGHCGECQACITACPTGAIVAPYRLDARRCISYLTIEEPGPIPVEWRPLIGNRLYGCDDCQLVCPWNKYAQVARVVDFEPRAHGQGQDLLALWAWDESTFLHRTEGSAIRRIGHERWLRNVAVVIGNALRTWDDRTDETARQWCAAACEALMARRPEVSDLVREHLDWALQQAPKSTAALWKLRSQGDDESQ